MTEEKKINENKADNKKPKEEPTKQIKKISEESKKHKDTKQEEKIKDVPEKKEEKEPVFEKSSEIKESSKEPNDKIEDTKEEILDESIEQTDKSEEIIDAKEKKSDIKKKPTESKSDKKTKKKDEKDEDFSYIVRIANTDIDGDKNIVMGISQIKGIGRHMAVLVTDATGIDKKTKMGKLSEAQIEKIREALENISSIAPGWMLNHRKDIDTGEDIHLISSDVDLRLRDDVNLLKMIRSYRGIRHESGLPVRGQRTRANNRRGLALGVSKKKV